MLPLKELVSLLATVCTIALFASSLKTVSGFSSNGVGNVPFFPFAATVLNCTLWMKYGFLFDDWTIIFVNGVGLLFGIYYVASYYRFTDQKEKVESWMLYILLFLLPVLLYAQYTVSYESARGLVGLVCCLMSIALFGSPLVTLRQVIQTKSTATLNFSLCVMNFLASFFWTVYGLQLGDSAVIVPNAVGCFLGSVQLGLFAFYDSAGGDRYRL